MNTTIWILFVTQFVVPVSLFLSLPSFRRGLLFGVTVPVDFADSPEGKAIVRRYRIFLLSGFALCFFSGVAGLIAGHAAVGSIALAAFFVAAILYWTRAHKQTVPYRASVAVVRTAELRPASTRFPWLQAASALPLAIVAWMLHRNWALLPEEFPRRWGLDGDVSMLAHRSIGDVYGPVFIGAALFLFLLLLAAGGPRVFKQSKQVVCHILSAVSWMVTLILSIVAAIPLALVHHLPASTIEMAIVGISSAGALGVAILVAVTASHSRKTLSPYCDTPDAGWKAGGIVYFNPADPALWVDKRLGMGWTLNFARPQSWLVLGALVAVVMVAVIAISRH